jgi:hypothetical protein
MIDQQLINELWESDEANALTNHAAREIERLNSLHQEVINERNAAWATLEANGLPTGYEVSLEAE